MASQQRHKYFHFSLAAWLITGALALLGCTAALPDPSQPPALTPTATPGLSPTPIPTLPAPSTPQLTVTPAAVGVLRGQVYIGPLQPVERVGEPTPTPNPSLFADRWVLVYADDGTSLLRRLPIAANGTYVTELAPGSYALSITRRGIESSDDTPRPIVIQANQTLVADVHIDTGIR